MKQLMLGNAAVARGLYEAGCGVVSSYPGTPSTEITEECAKYDEIYCEWAPNEKVAMEVAFGASLAGKRSFCGMKHVGLNVAADPLFTMSYTGVNGGMVIGVADDAGMHSSQNEQDSRHYARAAKVPMLEPSDSAEALAFAKLAYELSEQFDTPVLLKMCTRVAHSQSIVDTTERAEREMIPYEKNIAKYVMMPGNAKRRHPVVEVMGRDALFVPNDTYMDNKDNLAAIITGPNMAGKSTYMRQVALMVLMAQMGSFVPARAAHIGVVDRIFTRIGASDDLAGGQSTFMVEMTEVAELLRHATSRSLLILDEIGRGTSTYDGMSIARAVLEWCANPKRLGAKTLFATHYHELTVLEGQLPGVKNFNIAARKRKDEILFLRKIVPGGADQSYGIEVAGLAGLPPKVIRRAREILAELESQQDAPKKTGAREASQVSLTALGEEEVLTTLRNTPVETLTPLQALNLLHELKEKL